MRFEGLHAAVGQFEQTLGPQHIGVSLGHIELHILLGARGFGARRGQGFIGGTRAARDAPARVQRHADADPVGQRFVLGKRQLGARQRCQIHHGGRLAVQTHVGAVGRQIGHGRGMRRIRTGLGGADLMIRRRQPTVRSQRRGKGLIEVLGIGSRQARDGANQHRRERACTPAPVRLAKRRRRKAQEGAHTKIMRRNIAHVDSTHRTHHHLVRPRSKLQSVLRGGSRD